MDNVIVWLSAADILVTVDTGPMHVAAALGIPIVALGQSSRPDLHLNDQTDFIIIEPAGLDCLNCQERECPKDAKHPPCQQFSPDVIASWAAAKLHQKYGDYVSAVIACYQPELETLQRCLDAVLPQVQEIVIGIEANSRLPEGIVSHPKIVVARKNQAGIGYGRNTNHAARQTTGKYILFLNDDVFIAPDAVAKMREVMGPGVGAVANRLMYPDGTVYHAGKYRPHGAHGWGHLNHRETKWDIKEPRELENVCGACLLVPREAFYGINCFDEEFFLYAEDDDFALRLRQAGHKIMFTPHSEGIHLEHQSTKKIGDVESLAKKGGELLDRKWGWYFDKNKDNEMGTFK
jgi:GT2 family glycosyltransferase